MAGMEALRSPLPMLGRRLRNAGAAQTSQQGGGCLSPPSAAQSHSSRGWSHRPLGRRQAASTSKTSHRVGEAGRRAGGASGLQLPSTASPAASPAQQQRRLSKSDSLPGLWKMDRQDSGQLHPPSFYCPISRQCMHDPVVLSDGHTYERRYIDQWLESNRSSPVSGVPLSSTTTVPNHALRNAIEEYFEGILRGHRRTIRKTIQGLQVANQRKPKTEREVTAELVRTIDSLMQCSVLVNADLSIERVLKFIMEEAKSLIGAEVASVFLVDHESQELFSNVNSTGGEIRIPLNSGVAGRVASSGTAVRTQDAYTHKFFNTAVDAQTGFRTRNLLCVPIQTWKWGVFGVAELINKKSGGVADPEDMTFSESDQTLFEMLVSQAAVAIANSGWYDLEQEKAIGRGGAGTTTAPPTGGGGGSARMRSKGSVASSSGDRRNSTMIALPSLSGKPLPVEGLGGIDATSSKGCAQDEEVVGLLDGRRGSDCGKYDRPQTPLHNAQMAVVKPMLEEAAKSWNLDSLLLAELSKDRPLSLLGPVLIKEAGFLEYFGLRSWRVDNFFQELERGYAKEVPYHNRSHATSVMHLMHSILTHGGVAEAVAVGINVTNKSFSHVVRLVTFAGVLAAAIHDYEHAGVNNDFLVKSASKRALRYNDKSPNENHHVAAAFRLMQQPECNFLEGMRKEDSHLLRELIVDMVLGTDVAVTGQTLHRVKELLFAKEEDLNPHEAYLPSCKEDVKVCLRLALNCADIGHLTMPWPSHLQWVNRLEDEFFQQGDEEKRLGLSVSFLMDRAKPGVTHLQVGFFDNVARPAYTTLARAFPECQPLVSGLEANFAKWQDVAVDAALGKQPETN